MRFRVLVVEDEPALQETLKEYLEPAYKVVVASTVKEAKDALEKVTLKVVLVDLGLPDANGLNLIKHVCLNNSNHNNKIAVLALTGDKSEKSVKEAIELGVDNYLIKPVDKDLLHDRIKKAIFKHGFSMR